MKKILILTVVTLFAMGAKAQLRVDSVGNIRVNSTANTNYKFDLLSSAQGLQSTVKNSTLSTTVAIDGTAWHQTANNTAYGVRGRISGSWLSGPCYGVYGATNVSSSSQNYGVWGSIAPNVNGAAIYGTIYYSSTVLDDHYAGYFDGPVKVLGNLSVTGTMLNASAPSSSSSILALSDRNPADSEVCSTKLSSLTPRVFNANPKEEEEEKTQLTVEETQSLISRQVYSKQHYGLSAEQLEEVFPDLVYDNEDGTKSINYVEMVPILVQAINELKSEIDVLKGDGGNVKKLKGQATSVDGIGGSVTLLSLGQNKPNPFGTSTSIEVSIPEDVQSAFIYVYDLTGKKLQQVDIAARGKQNVTLNAASLTDGMYLYSLIADGKIVETRRMIVEK